jgi:hypothetical protein
MKEVSNHKLALSVVFLVIARMNNTPLQYIFDDAAQDLFENRFDEVQSITETNLRNHIVK